MLGGVTVNFILAVIIYIGLSFAYGDQYIKNDSVQGGVWVVEEEIKKFMQRLVIEFFSSIKENGILQDFHANIFMLNLVSNI